MKILLLGTTGLLGHNVLKQLLFDGHEVVVLLRNPKKLLIEDDRIKVLKGQLDLESIRMAATGCDAIINCAGVTDMSLLSLEDYLPVNAGLAGILVEVMKCHGIKTLVHTSTANTIGFGTREKLSDESCPMQHPFDKSYYAVSKLQGESILTKTAERCPDWHIVIVNPGFMIGAYDVRPSSGALLLAGFRKPVMAATHGGKSFVAASDAARAIVNALCKGRNGERYLLTGSNMSLREFYALEADTMGYRQAFVALPNWLVAIAGMLGNVLRMCRIKTQLSTRNVRQLMVTEHYDNSKAVRELDMPQTPIRVAISDFFGWWGNNK